MWSLLEEFTSGLADEHRNPDRLAALQARRLRAFVESATKRTALYGRLYREAGIDPRGISSLDDLRRLPVVDHIWYRRQPIEDRVASGIDVSRCRQRRTSGSSGVPLVVYCTPRESRRRALIWYRARWLAGIRPGWKQLTVGTVHNVKVSPWLSPWHKHCGIDRAGALMRSYRPDVLHGYPSQLVILAQRLRAEGGPVPKLRAVTLGGETLTAAHRELLESFFGARVFDFYGTHETGVVARPCRAGPGFHVTSRHFLVEILRDNRPAQPGEEGSVVLTSLLSEAMPILRYAIGDTAVAGTPGCACGSALGKIETFIGRAAETVRTPDGRAISSMFIAAPFLGRPEVVQYRVTQRDLSTLCVDLVTTEEPSADLVNAIGRRFAETFGGVRTEVRRVEALAPDASGKQRRFVPLKDPAS